MAPRVVVHDTAAELAAAVAEAFVERVSALTPDDGTPAHEVALTGGTIARSVHREIAARAAGVPWGLVRFWFGDERFVPAGSPERNAGQARVDLLDVLEDLPGEWPAAALADNIVEVPAVGEVEDVQTAAEVYADLLRFEGTGGFDTVMLGMGPDGHVASLFPGHPATAVTDAVTVAVTDSPKPPPERVSLTFEALLRDTGAVWFLVSGEEKAEAVARVLAPDPSATGSPAGPDAGQRGGPDAVLPARQLLERADPSTEITFWLDAPAASLLP